MIWSLQGLYSGHQIQSLEPSPLHHEGNWETKSFVNYMPNNLQDYSVYLGMYHMLNTVKLQNYFHEFCFNGKIILVSLGIEPVPYI